MTSHGRAFSPTRRAVLRAVEASPTPSTIRGLGAELGLHDNTVRMHLTALHRDGFIRQAPSTEPAGRGRPATRWESEQKRSSPYVTLVKILASQLRKESNNPRAAAQEAGLSWGHALGKRHETPTAAAPAPRETLVEILRAEGFAPESDGDTIAFRHCPLIEAASSDTDIVCAVHLGMVTGALEHLGAREDEPTLIPFAAPGICTLHLRSTG